MSLFRVDFNPEKRVFGLDLFRAISILIVLKVHGNFLLEYYFPNLRASIGISGPELFFVLSGYLIGQIFITHLNRSENPTAADVWQFIRRRWFRTLPNYYLFLLFNLATVYYFQRQLNWWHLSYFVFGQNLFTDIPPFFQESWSLTIEEWFYISMPFWIFLFYKVWGIKNLWWAIISYLGLILVFRIIGYHAFISDVNLEALKPIKRVTAIMRLDSIMLGVAAAYFKLRHQKVWYRYRYHLLFLGITIIYGSYFMRYQLSDFNYFSFFFLIQSIGATMLLSIFDAWRKASKFWRYIITHISLVSYSMYLSNIPLLRFVFIPLAENQSIPFWLLFIIFIVSNVLISTFVFKYFEKPLMDLRDGKSINLRALRGKKFN